MRSQVYPYFAFENAKEAIAYYQKYFGATDVYRLSPKPEQAEIFHLSADANLDDLTMHAGFTIIGMKFECADSFTGPVQPSNQVTLMLDIDSEDEESNQAAEDLYNNLVKTDAIDIKMPFEEQFWGGKMGSFTDKYGVSWMLHTSPWSQSQDHKDE